jgi:hypothetical protein
MDAQSADILGEFVRQGVLGLIIVAFVTGLFVPKWVLDEYRKRIELKDAIIARQSALIERLAEKAEARRRGDGE